VYCTPGIHFVLYPYGSPYAELMNFGLAVTYRGANPKLSVGYITCAGSVARGTPARWK
jgi:hypothetical protein